MIKKRILAGVLMTMFLLPSAMIYTMATDKPADSTTNKSETSATSAPTQPPTGPETIGYKAYADMLDKIYYKGNLGATYSKRSTTFKLWAPSASTVKVCIYKTGTDSEQGAEMLSATTMKYSKKYGTWYLTLNGDYKNKYYTYKVTVNGKENEVVDPYAKAAGANGDRGMIVDLASTNPKNWSKDSFNRVNYACDAVVWEISVRDFSDSETSGVSEKNRGKYLAFTESETTVGSKEGSLSTCVDYLKELGVNYVQINPFYDFGSIDETKTENPDYNWGYDPKNYNVPEGSYSSNPYDGNVRIKECKEMIQALHKAGIGVIMDVVYNHTYLSEDSWFNLIVPDYYYRISDEGVWSNGSGCGNDTASERVMFREFMKNSVMYWAEEYHIDGFRFDLMGLHDVDTMNYIRKNLDTLKDGGKILMYGEAWSLDTDCSSDTVLATQSNMSKLSQRIGAFNDTTRDAIKGNVFDDKAIGYVQDGSSKAGIRAGIGGQCTAGDWAISPNQCVNYASCHDNLTLYDKLVKTQYDDDTDYRLRYEDLVAMNKLSAAITLTSQGMPFMLAGEEMGRSKDGDDNSYKSPVEENRIDWNSLNRFNGLVEYYKGLIAIRNTLGIFSDNTADSANRISYIDDTPNDSIAYTLKSADNKMTVAVAFNPSNSKKTTIQLPGDKMPSQWVILANDLEAGMRNLGTIPNGEITLEKSSCMILVDKASFDALKNKSEDKSVFIRYTDKSTDTVVYEQTLHGKQGEEYSAAVPNDILLNYNVTSSVSDTSGVFADKPLIVNVSCKPYTGEYSSVKIRFVDENGEEIANSIEMTNRVKQQYYTMSLPGVFGYKLDLNNLPKNGSGVYTKEPIEVVYHYESIFVSPEGEAIDPDALENPDECYANVIYMGDEGEILDTKSYMGTKDDKVKVTLQSFEGYDLAYEGAEAVFSSTESNIIVSYERQSKGLSVLIITAISVSALAVLCGGFLIVRRSKRKKLDELHIEEV